MVRIISYILLTVFVASLLSCDSGAGGGSSQGGSNIGATAGGVQDMSFARNLVIQGKVPPAEAFIVEAMFSEHDLPVDGPICETTLCLRGAMGIAPDENKSQAGWVQIGMSSNIVSNEFQRDAITLIAAVDVSGSMGWPYQDSDTPLATAKALLSAVANQLDENDQFALVTYGSTVSIPLSLTAGNSSNIISAINGLEAGGSTNMEAGLRTAYLVADEALTTSNNVRIMLFTDIQPNVGATEPSEFERIVSAGADKGVGLSVMGIGLGLGSEFLQSMSHLRGGNAFTVMRVAEVGSFMEDNWPWMVSPIAYNLTVLAKVDNGGQIEKTYGFPNNGLQQEIGFDVATVFLSKRKGALLLKIQSEDYNGLGVNLDLQYEENNGVVNNTNIRTVYEGQALDGNGVYMPQLGIAKTVALALLVSEMKRAATLYQSDQETAIFILTDALQRFISDAAAIQDAAIDKEAEFWPALLTLMEEGAEQESFYGQF